MKNNIYAIISEMKNTFQRSINNHPSRIDDDELLTVLKENNDRLEKYNQLKILQAQRDVLQSEMKYLIAQRGSEKYTRLHDQLDVINRQIMDMKI